MSKIVEGYISVTGGRVWYRIVGANKKGISLLALHGGPGAPHDYLEPLEALADERPVIFYDQLGCGNSDKPDDKSLWIIERFVDELGQVREALGLKKIHILGQSWGSMLATDYMLTRPDGVVSLVFSGPCLSASRYIRDSRAYVFELPESVQKVIQESEANRDFSSKEFQDAMMLFYKLHVCRLEPWPDCMNRTVDRLKEITVPVLFTCGRYDIATPDSTKYYQNNLPGSEIAIFEDASHEHHIEKSKEYLQVVRDFLHRAEKR